MKGKAVLSTSVSQVLCTKPDTVQVNSKCISNKWQPYLSWARLGQENAAKMFDSKNGVPILFQWLGYGPLGKQVRAMTKEEII